jgi:hypothetical protein
MVELGYELEFRGRGQGCAMDSQTLNDAISQIEMDASNVKLTFEDSQAVALNLKQALEYLDKSENDPEKREEHLRSGFASLGKARGILGVSSVQSTSYRRHQWPFLPPEADPLK